MLEEMKLKKVCVAPTRHTLSFARMLGQRYGEGAGLGFVALLGLFVVVVTLASLSLYRHFHGSPHSFDETLSLSLYAIFTVHHSFDETSFRAILRAVPQRPK